MPYIRKNFKRKEKVVTFVAPGGVIDAHLIFSLIFKNLKPFFGPLGTTL